MAFSLSLSLSLSDRGTVKDDYRHLQREYMNARVAEDAGWYYLAAFVMANPNDVFWLLVPPIVSRKI